MPTKSTKTAGTDWTLNLGMSGGTEAHHLTQARCLLPFTNTRHSIPGWHLRLALFACNTSFPIKNMRSAEALEGNPCWTLPMLNIANTCCNAGSLRKARSLRPSSFFDIFEPNSYYSLSLALELLELWLASGFWQCVIPWKKSPLSSSGLLVLLILGASL